MRTVSLTFARTIEDPHQVIWWLCDYSRAGGAPPLFARLASGALSASGTTGRQGLVQTLRAIADVLERDFNDA